MFQNNFALSLGMMEFSALLQPPNNRVSFFQEQVRTSSSLIRIKYKFSRTVEEKHDI